MKEIVKNGGIMLILIGIGFLVYSLLKGMNTNQLLIISGVLIVLGLVAHIFLNKYFA